MSATTDPDAGFPVMPERARTPTPGAAAILLDIIDESAANTATGARIAVKVAPIAVKSVVGTALGSVRQLLPVGGLQRLGAPKSENGESTPRTLLKALST